MAVVRKMVARVEADGTKSLRNKMNSATNSMEGLENQANGTGGSLSLLQNRVNETGDEALSSGAQLKFLESRVDELGDELIETAGEAAFAGSMMGGATGSAYGLAGGVGALNVASTGLATKLGLIGAAIAGLATLAVPVVGVFGGLAFAFAAITGTGFLAWSNEAGNSLGDLKEQIKPLLVQFGQQFIPLIDAAVAALPGFIQSVLDATGNLDPFVQALMDLGAAGQRMIPKLTTFFLDLARRAMPILRNIGSYLEQNFIPGFRKLSNAGIFLWGVMADLEKVFRAFWPVLSLVFDAIVRGVVLIRDGVQAFLRLNEALDGLLAPALAISTAIVGITTALITFGPAIAAAGIALAGLAAPVALIVGAIVGLTAIIIGLKKAWDSNFLGIRDTTIRVFNLIKSAIQQAMQFIRDTVINPIVNQIRNVWNRHGDELRSEAKETWNAVQGYFNTLKTTIWPAIQWFIGVAQAAWNKFGDEIKAYATFVWEGIAGIVGTWLDALFTALSVAMDLIQGDWEEAWGKIKAFFQRTLTGIQEFADKWGGRLGSWVEGLVGDITDWFGKLPDELEEHVQDFVSTGEDFIQGIVDGIDNMASDLGEKARTTAENAANGLIDKFNDVLPDNFTLPELTIGGGTFAGEKVPKKTFGGQSMDIPELATGGMIKEAGAAILHEGERVLNPAEVDRAMNQEIVPGENGGEGDTYNTQNVEIDVKVPKGTDVDTAARTIADEVKSIGMDN